MRRICEIIVHSSSTPSSMDIGVKEIDKWHRDRNFRMVGYHFVIRRNGLIEKGRDVGDTGAHVRGYNLNSIGICWVGGTKNGKAFDNRTTKQKKSMFKLIRALLIIFDIKMVLGHKNVGNTECPSFDAKKEFENIG